MAGQSNIKVDAGTGSPVDFSVTNSTANFRQAVTIGDPLIDANYVNVSGGAANVVGSMVITNSPTVVLGSGSNVVGTITISPSGVQNIQGTITNVAGGTINANLTQIAGTGIAFNNGTTSNGVQRVTISSDSTGQVILGTGSNEAGKIIAHVETGSIYNNLTGINPSFGSISFSASGNNIVVGTVNAKQIRVVAMQFLVSTATNIYFTDSAGGPNVWGSSTSPANFAANSGIVLPFNQVGWFQTTAGNALVANLSTASSVAGCLTYIAI